MEISDTALAFLLVVAAGASTCIGAAAVYQPTFIKLANKTTLASSLGLSAGVMLYVSFIEIFGKSVDAFESSGLNSSDSYLFATLCFFVGFVLMNLMNMLVHILDPDDITHDDIDFEIFENVAQESEEPFANVDAINLSTPEPQALTEEGIELQNNRLEGGTANSSTLKHRQKELDLEDNRSVVSLAESLHDKKKKIDEKLHRMGLVTALAIGVHNFPEGLATFVATLDNPTVGLALAVAIAIHNIPEGLCVSIPIYFASGDRHKAFMWGCLSGASEIVAAGLGWLVLAHVVGDEVYAVLFGSVAGMMINICIYQLIPTAHKYDPTDKVVSNSILVGMAIMALSLVVFLY